MLGPTRPGRVLPMMMLSLGAMGNLLRATASWFRAGLIGPSDRAAQEGTAMEPRAARSKKFMLDAKAIALVLNRKVINLWVKYECRPTA